MNSIFSDFDVRNSRMTKTMEARIIFQKAKIVEISIAGARKKLLDLVPDTFGDRWAINAAHDGLDEL